MLVVHAYWRETNVGDITHDLAETSLGNTLLKPHTLVTTLICPPGGGFSLQRSKVIMGTPPRDFENRGRFHSENVFFFSIHTTQEELKKPKDHQSFWILGV